MVLRPHTIDIRGKLILLGTGTSVGVPTVGCGCRVCTSRDPRNRRTRSAAIVGLDSGNLLIDTPPDLHHQLLREQIGVVDAVLFTHAHADHIFGLDDLRMFPFFLGHAVPLYAEPKVEAVIRGAFSYAFDPRPVTHEGAVPQLEFTSIGLEPFEVLGVQVTPIRLQHGPRFEVLGFRFGRVAYCTDVKSVPPASWPLLEDLDVLVLGALRRRPHVTHFSIDEALEVVQRVRPKRTILTHMSHEVDYAEVAATLPHQVELGYDGMQIPLSW